VKLQEKEGFGASKEIVNRERKENGKESGIKAQVRCGEALHMHGSPPSLLAWRDCGEKVGSRGTPKEAC
jgi:hypothetical protein